MTASALKPALGPAPLLSPALPARHGFFTRQGGVSTGPYASLNGSTGGGDDPAAVAENRRRVAGHLGAAAIVGMHQVHGADVVTVEEPWEAGRGPRADAAVTRRPGIALCIITADCAPVLLHDAQAGVIGAVHAGWRGAVAGVLTLRGGLALVVVTSLLIVSLARVLRGDRASDPISATVPVDLPHDITAVMRKAPALRPVSRVALWAVSWAHSRR